MTSDGFFPRAALYATAAACVLVGCAGGPEASPSEPRAEVVADPVTGSNIPRRDRKPAGSSNVTGSGAAKDGANQPQAPTTPN